MPDPARVLLSLAVAALLAPAAARAQAPTADTAWLTSSHWDDGRAEVAFYEVHRSRNQYGRPDDQTFLVGTYLVKHEFDPATRSKAAASAEGGVPAFKWALFYEIESGSYQYKRAYVTNAAQADLAPLKASFTSFDWCSNLYREQDFLPDGRVESLVRSDDYGNRATSVALSARAYPVAELPLLVRGLDFSVQARQELRVVLLDGTTVEVTATLEGRETVETAAGRFETEKIVLRYASEVPSPVGEQADTIEHYWRATGEGRHLVRLAADGGRYSMELVETVRSPYWRENLFPDLERVRSRP